MSTLFQSLNDSIVLIAELSLKKKKNNIDIYLLHVSSPRTYVRVTMVNIFFLRLKKVLLRHKADLKGRDKSLEKNWFTQFTHLFINNKPQRGVTCIVLMSINELKRCG